MTKYLIHELNVQQIGAKSIPIECLYLALNDNKIFGIYCFGAHNV